MTYPLEFEFKVLALAPQFYVRDSSGRNVAYVKQKLFKLKEDISVFEDESQQNIIFKIKANQWIDWSASYIMYDKENRVMGRVGRKGARSLWKATYEVFDDADHKEFIIEEENAFVKIMDGVFSEVPILGIFTGYFFNPKYTITNTNGELVAVFSKEQSFWGKKFSLNQLIPISELEEQRVILALIMVVLLERSRG
ncbi:MAG: hypothetical protein WAT22_15970 [Saprospiraceae bacterium]|nr:hypothetical protein [Saprospiraceae bacterium]MBP6447729.1 hypothetical protein [Saprospiraceae bacterium]